MTRAASAGSDRGGLPGALPVAVLLAALFGAACGPGGSAEGRALLDARCGGCHGVDLPLSVRKDAEGWRRTLWAMRQRGAALTDEEAEILLRYLTEVRGP